MLLSYSVGTIHTISWISDVIPTATS